jgi:hypothetical protein
MKLTLHSAALVTLVVSAMLGGTTARAQDRCSAEQQEAVNRALERAYIYATNAMDDLVSVNNGGDTSRFDRWFSSTDNGALSDVSMTMSFIWGRLASVSYLCVDEAFGECQPGTAAFVLPGLPSIRICPKFFEVSSLDEFGAGVLIHEVSHLVNTVDDVGKTIDCDIYGLDWPMFYSEQLDQSVQVRAAENYRLYALDWQPNDDSELACGEPF